tara:strand:+ start:5188 stop:5646 length:459 start_codon:yes stop_codon:yes gene_type:complete
MQQANKNIFRQKISRLSSRESKLGRGGSWRIAGDLPSSFKYASQGISYGIKTQRNFRIHSFTGIVVISLGIWLKLSFNQLSVLVLTIAAVLVLELLNTSIEAVVDLSIGRRYHPLARVAKDCAAGAVLIASISSLFIGCFLIIPPLFNKLGI